jgi:hypothetical protein
MQVIVRTCYFTELIIRNTITAFLKKEGFMLKVATATGSIEASADEERRVRGLSDAALCRELNQAAIAAATGLLARRGAIGDVQADPFVWAELQERPHIKFGAFGWHFTSRTGGGRHAEP